MRDPRLAGEGNVIEDAFASIRDDYKAPKYPIVLAHGLFGFDEIHPAGRMLPGVQYWSGIEEALAVKGIEVITATVPPSDRIEVRAQQLADDISAKANGKAVNIIAYDFLLLPEQFLTNERVGIAWYVTGLAALKTMLTLV